MRRPAYEEKREKNGLTCVFPYAYDFRGAECPFVVEKKFIATAFYLGRVESYGQLS